MIPANGFTCTTRTGPPPVPTANEDDGVAVREVAWAQYKKQIRRWFFWESTYYNNYQGGYGRNQRFSERDDLRLEKFSGFRYRGDRLELQQRGRGAVLSRNSTRSIRPTPTEWRVLSPACA